ncbi:hypothetical protein BI001_gp208 [Bacillus phage Zuko]|uniref:hypothetical protein n=1 Tax=Bacillus phage Zuko TaxID=1805956 RepID=UPI0007A76CDE|nr:hypothetical protein BI001_gp208 [Bacillus phage Zuko]AMW62524.1 hypothetical protein ZUKO_170 [Bacillus phage Zuko]
MKLPKEMKLVVTEVRLKGATYTYGWSLHDDMGIVKYGSTLEDPHVEIYKGKLVNIEGTMYMVVKTTMEVLDSRTIKNEVHFMEVDDDQWVIQFEDKVKGDI